MASRQFFGGEICQRFRNRVVVVISNRMLWIRIGRKMTVHNNVKRSVVNAMRLVCEGNSGADILERDPDVDFVYTIIKVNIANPSTGSHGFSLKRCSIEGLLKRDGGLDPRSPLDEVPGLPLDYIISPWC